MTATVTSIHGELDCAATESLLVESMNDADSLREQNAELVRRDVVVQGEMSTLRAELHRLRGLVGDMSVRKHGMVDETAGLRDQVTILNDELAAAERDALPFGTYTHATISDADILALYRRFSRVRRGPLPRDISDALAAGQDEIVTAMVDAGQAAAERVVRRAVRARARRRS